ncbi:MAG: hypothetical protein ACT4NL_04880 [Pseudomarimonas sp.]
MFKDSETVIAKRYPEQGIVASLCCLRLLGERSPKNLSVHFTKRDLERARNALDRWFELVQDQLSPARLEAIRLGADREFALFDEMITKKKRAVAVVRDTQIMARSWTPTTVASMFLAPRYSIPRGSHSEPSPTE